MKLKSKIIIIIISSIVLIVFGITSVNYLRKEEVLFNSDPEIDGYVPDKTTAIKIAETIWLPIYGKAIYEHKPFTAVLVNGNVWRITGTVHSEKGGAPIAEIQKSDCRILLISHGK
ncbi:MAG: YbbC/YhhH family protein [Bacteroidetes bacterium]|nr:YbbC/YhhH family protein [Bacteroidota bacterium]